MINLTKKIISVFVLLCFTTLQILPNGWAESIPTVILSDAKNPERDPSATPQDDMARKDEIPETSMDFLTASPLSQADVILSEAKNLDPSATLQDDTNYDYERYEFEDALDLLRPEYASAVIVKNLTAEDIQSLLELDFETAVVVLRGEIVLFTSGSDDELYLSAPARQILNSASFVSHTHPSDSHAEGPSEADYQNATDQIEYMISEDGVYAYDQNAASTISINEYLNRLNQAATTQDDSEQVKTRAALNTFIKEMDLVNDMANEDKELFRAAAITSFSDNFNRTSLGIDWTTIRGSYGLSSNFLWGWNSYPIYDGGVVLNKELSSNDYELEISLQSVNGASGANRGFLVRYQDLNNYYYVKFSRGGQVTIIKKENGVSTTLASGSVGSLVQDSSWYRFKLIVEGNSLKVYYGGQLKLQYQDTNNPFTTGKVGLYSDLYSEKFDDFTLTTIGSTPTVPVPTVGTLLQFTNASSATLSGTKAANASIWINGVERVTLNASTTWSYSASLVEGLNSFSITAKDNTGTESSVVTTSTTRDTIVPTGSVDINSGATYATSTSVTLNLSATDTNLDKMNFSTDNVNWSAQENYAATKTFTLPAGDGAKIVYVKYFDKAGNVSVVYSKAVTLDSTAPTGTVKINNDAQYSNSATVTLNLTGTDATSGLDQMRFSTDGTNWSAWEAFATTKSNFSLPTGDGTKTVYVQLRDKAGLSSVNLTDTITLDTTPPAIVFTSAQLTNNSSYTLTYTVDGVSTQETKTLVEGANSLSVTKTDAAGNSTTKSLTVTLDSVAPAISAVTTGSLTSTSVTITWTTDEASDTQVEYGTTTSYGSQVSLSPLSTTHSQPLTSLAAGTLYHYRVKSRDAAGNIRTSVDFTFTTSAAADTTPPIISAVTTSALTANSVTINWTTNEASDTQIEYGTTTSYGSTTTLDTSMVTAHLQSLSSLQAGTLYHYRVKSRDAAGNLQTSVDFTYTTSAAVPVTEVGLTTYLNFEGTSADQSSGGNNGTLQGGVTFSADHPNLNFSSNATSLNFDGINDYVSTTKSYTNPNVFTLALWFKTTSTTGGKLIGFGNYQTGQSTQYDRHLYMTNSGQIYFGVYPGSVQTINSAASYNDGQWHHVTATLSSAGMQLYIDGNLAASKTTVTSAENFTGYWKVGFDSVNAWVNIPSGFYFKGLMDDVRIYNRALSNSEVQDLAQGDLPAPDITAPTISAVTSSSITSSGATITWTTDEASDSQVEYRVQGTSAWTSNTLNTSMLANHSMMLSDLAANTAYEYQVKSRDAAGNLAIQSTISTFVTQSVLPPPVAEAGLMSYLNFEGNVLDQSGNNNNGTLVNGAALSTAAPTVNFTNANSLSFDGMNDYAQIANSSSLNFGAGNFAISLWIRPDTVTNPKQAIVDKTDGTNGYRLITSDTDGDRLKFIRGAYFADGIQSNDGALTAGIWQHVSVVINNNQVTFYVNGASKGGGTLPANGRSATSTTNLFLGQKGYSGSSVNFFDGGMDDVRLYNRALSLTEIQSLASGNLYTDATPPVVAFTSPATATDQNYTLTYTIDGQSKSESWVLGSGANQLIVNAADAAGNVTTATHIVNWAAPSVSDPVPSSVPEDALISMATADGLVMKYLEGDLVMIEKLDEYTFSTLEFDEDQNLIGGVLKYLTGTEVYYKNNLAIWWKDSRGNKYYFNTNGSVREKISSDNIKEAFAYRKNVQNEIDSRVISSPGLTVRYNLADQLMESIKTTGEIITYDNGVLKQVKPASGPLITYAKTILLAGVKVTLNSSAATTYPASIEYDVTGQTKEVVEQSGRRILFENGLPISVIETNGLTTAYDFETDSLDQFSGLSANRLGYIQRFDSNGDLTSIQLTDNSEVIIDGDPLAQVERFEIIGSQIKKILLDDGTSVKVDGFSSGSDHINDGTLAFPDGSSSKYANGELIEIKTVDGLVYQITKSGGDYIAHLNSSSQNVSTEKASEFTYDENMNLIELKRLNEEVVHFRDNKIDLVVPDCDAGQTDCEEPQYFYYETDRTVVVQGPFTTQPDLLTLPVDGSLSYSVSLYDLQGQPLEMKTFEPTKLTKVIFSYGQIRSALECALNGTNCEEKFKYTYEFDSLGNEIMAVDDLSTHIVRRYMNDHLYSVTTPEHVTTTYQYNSQNKLIASQMTWQGKVLESYQYAYDEAQNLTKITDSKGVTKIYDPENLLVRVAQGNQEFKIHHFTENGEDRTAQELVKETTADGSVYHYQMGKVIAIEYSDGTLVSEIIEDASGELFSAKIERSNGFVERVVNGKKVEISKPDGSFWTYEDGKLIQNVDFYGQTTRYQYTEDEIILLQNNGARTIRYDRQGSLLGVETKPFFDLSTSSHLLSPQGNAQVDIADSQISDASIRFDGNGDYLSVASHSDFDFGADDFTIDTWIKLADPNRDHTVASKYNEQTGQGWVFLIESSNLKIRLFDSAWTTVSVPVTFDMNWHHVAVVKKGNVIKFFKDGMQQGSDQTAASSYNGAVTDLWIGAYGPNNANSPFYGSMDELRISKGIARWSSNFSPNLESLQPDSYTKLLLRTDQDEDLSDVLSQIDTSLLSLSTISYAGFGTTFSQTTENQDLGKAKIISHIGNLITVEQPDGSWLEYQSGNLIKEAQAGTNKVRQYEYNSGEVIVRESGSVKSFNVQDQLFRFVDYKGIIYNVTALMSGGNVVGYQLSSADAAVTLNLTGQITSSQIFNPNVTISQDQFVDFVYQLGEVPLSLSDLQIQGTVKILEDGDVRIRIVKSGEVGQFNGNLISITKTDGSIYEYESGQLKILTEASGRVLQYGTSGDLITVDDGNYTYYYDSQGTLKKYSYEEAGQTHTYELDSISHLNTKHIIEENGAVLKEELFDGTGRLVRELNRVPESNSGFGPNLTISGNTFISTDGKFGGGSAHFDGMTDATYDSVKIPNNSNYDFATGDFTVEAWVKLEPSTNTFFTVVSKFNQYQSPMGWAFTGDSYNNNLRLYDQNGSAITVSTDPFQQNVWYHLAVVRSGDQLYFFRDGQLQGSPQNVAGRSFNGAPNSDLKIGLHDLSSGPLGGSVDELRISKGTARWTTNFVPQVQEYIEDAQTSLLLHVNGFNYEEAQTTYSTDAQGITTVTTTDLIGLIRQEVKNVQGQVTYEKEKVGNHISFPQSFSVMGDARIDSAQPKFGIGSAQFDGTGDYLLVPDSDNFDFSGGVWTVDQWIYPTSFYNNNVIWSQAIDGQNFVTAMLVAGTAPGIQEVRFEIWNGGQNPVAIQTVGANITVGRTYHIEISENGNNYYIFVDGKKLAQISDPDRPVNLPAPFNIGYQIGANDGFRGYIDEFRVSKGAVRHTADFPLPTSEYVSDAQTTLFLHLNGADGTQYHEQSTAYVTDAQGITTATTTDSAGLLKEEKTNGQGQLIYQRTRGEKIDRMGVDSSVIINGQTYADQEAELGDGSASFDGFYDNLRFPDSDTFNFSDGTWTVDFWIKARSLDKSQIFYGQADAGNNKVYMSILSSGAVHMLFETPSTYPVTVMTPEGVFDANTWHHVVIVEDGDVYKIFVDGIDRTGPTLPGYYIGRRMSNFSGPVQLGSHAGVNIGYGNDEDGFNGWIDEFRVSDYARWTTNFPPPTQEYTEDQNTSLLLHFNRYQYEERLNPPQPLSPNLLPFQTDISIAILENTQFNGPLSIFERGPISDSAHHLNDDYLAGQMKSGETMYSVFDPEGKLLSSVRVDGTFTVYQNGKIQSVSDRLGQLIQSYVYDPEGNIIRITLHKMRNELPPKIQAAKENVDREKRNALKQLVEADQNAATQIEQQFAQARSQLESQRSNLEGQRYQTVCQKTLCWTRCQTVEVGGVSDAINQVNSALSDLSNQQAQAYANLTSQIQAAKQTIETQVGQAFIQIDEQERQFRREIVRQEISPVIFEYYRKILGRDPSQVEYDRWINETNFDQGLDIARLKEVLSGRNAAGQTVVTEYTAEREARAGSVSEIKTTISQFINNYKIKTKEEKIQAAATELGLTEQDLAFFTTGEADSILDWINSRGLHFGQSAFIALENLLNQAGIAFDREEIAKQLILIDILTGVISPFEEGELLISLFALKHLAGRMGLATKGLEIEFNDLYEFYRTHSGHKIIAHINGDHYIIVTDIKLVLDQESGQTIRKIVYTDPGAGSEGNNQVMEVSETEFLKVWQGNVLTTQVTADILIEQHLANPNLSANPPPRTLSKSEEQSIRGAFFFFLIPFFAAVWASVSAVAATVVAAIATTAAAIGGVLAGVIGTVATAISGAISAIVSGLSALGTAFLGITTQLLSAIPFVGPALGSVVQGVGSFVLGIAMTALGAVSTYIVPFASGILSFVATQFIAPAIAIGSFLPGGLEGVLTTIGVPPKVAHYIGVGVKIIGAIATGDPFSIAATFASEAVKEVGPRIGLSAGLTNALSVAASALSGTIAEGGFDPNSTVFQALKDAAPKLAANFAQAGIFALGDAVGLDWRITALIGLPIGAAVGGLVSGIGSGGGPTAIFNSIKDSLFSSQTLGGLVSVGASIGLDAIGAPPILQSFVPGVLGQLAASASGSTGGGGGPGPGGTSDGTGKSLLGRIGEAAQRLGSSIVRGAQSVVNFGSQLISDGWQATKDFFSGIFSRQTQEVMYQSSVAGGVGGGSATLDVGFELLDQTKEFDAQNNLVRIIEHYGNDAGDTATIVGDGLTNTISVEQNIAGKTFSATYENLGKDAFGQAALGGAVITDEVSNNLQARYIFNDGVFKEVDYLDINAGQELARIQAANNTKGLQFDERGNLFTGVMENFFTGTAYAYEAGQLMSTSIIRKDDTGIFTISSVLDPVKKQLETVYNMTVAGLESLYNTQIELYDRYLDATSAGAQALRQFLDEVFNLDGADAKVYNSTNVPELNAGVTVVDMKLDYYKFLQTFNLQDLDNLAADLIFDVANRRWRQGIEGGVPKIVEQMSDPANKIIITPGVNSGLKVDGVGDEFTPEEINALASTFATDGKRVMISHSAGTEAQLKAILEAKQQGIPLPDKFVFFSPRVSREQFEWYLDQAGIQSNQVLVVTADGDFPHYPTDLLSNEARLSGAVSADFPNFMSIYYDYENRNNKFNYLFLKEDLTYEADRANNENQLFHGGPLSGAIEDHRYKMMLNDVEIQDGSLREVYSDFANEDNS